MRLGGPLWSPVWGEYTMADGAVKPEIEDSLNEPENTNSEQTTSLENNRPAASGVSSAPIVWTPRFIVIFALILVSSLSIESLLTQGWLDRFYSGLWIFQLYVIFICLGWITLLVLTHSNWIRIGSVFGIIWAFFMTIYIITFSFNTDLAVHVQALTNAATCSALLGSYICLSIDKTPFNRLEAWLFGFAPLIVSILVTLLYFLTSSNDPSFSSLENVIATISLLLSILVWWTRPTLWKTQPGPAFLFGCVPFILLVISLASKQLNVSNYFLANVLSTPNPSLLTNEANFFFSQVALLFLFLGIIRVIQFERASTNSE